LSEYTKEEILKLIEENGGPEGLDLSGKDLSGVDLGREAIAAELERARKSGLHGTPPWFSDWTEGMNLSKACLQRANLQKAILEGADLTGARLQRANLQKAILEGADLTGARLQRAKLHKAILEGADLTEAKLQGAVLTKASLQKACLLGANLERAVLLDTKLQEADLEYTRLQKAYCRRANLQGAKLRRAHLQGALLEDANFQKVHLEYSHLEKVDFFAAESLEGAYFCNAFLDDTRMRREQLRGAIGEDLEEKYDEAKEAYLALKNNFAEIGRYRDESWAYVKERQMWKKMNHPRLARSYYRKEMPENPDAWRLGWFYIRHTAKWALDRVEEWTCDYGESVPKTLRAMGVALVGFAFVYWLVGAVVDVSGDPFSGWWHCLLYSGGAFTTFGVDTLRPANDWIRALSIFESGVGIALTGLLGFVLGNRIRRS